MSCPPRRSFVATDDRRRGQLATVSNCRRSTYLPTSAVQTSGASSVQGQGNAYDAYRRPCQRVRPLTSNQGRLFRVADLCGMALLSFQERIPSSRHHPPGICWWLREISPGSTLL